MIGRLWPGVAIFLDRLSHAQVSIPIAVCLFFMMFPIMVKIDFSRITAAARTPKPVGLTLVVNWLIKPFSMYAIAYLFLRVLFRDMISGTEIIDGESVELHRSYISGAILLGIAPCTAMVLMWGFSNPCFCNLLCTSQLRYKPLLGIDLGTFVYFCLV